MAGHAKLRAKHVWGGGRGPARVGRRAWTPWTAARGTDSRFEKNLL
jgi:hypothetical protein